MLLHLVPVFFCALGLGATLVPVLEKALNGGLFVARYSTQAHCNFARSKGARDVMRQCPQVSRQRLSVLAPFAAVRAFGAEIRL